MGLKAKVGCCLLAAAVTAGVVPAGPAAAAPAPTGSGGLKAGGPFRGVTLVTGDRLQVATDGSNRVAVLPTKGRERIGFVSEIVRGHLQVTPADAVPLVNAGRLDRRLFDVTSLLQYGYDDRRADLPLIVTYVGGQGRSTVQASAATTGATVVRELPAVSGLAVKQQRQSAAAFWSGLTGDGVGAQARGLRGEISKVWLDALRQPSLDVSVPQIGAPQAWQDGYTGADVPVGVVDTGIDDTHPDLAGKVVAKRNFTDDGDTLDHVGHGTHVASTIAGSGAASSGKYKGVAPGAKLADAKVCLIFGCQESWILDGMQWAAADQHAKVINMSLGGPDSPDVDPLEEAVKTLTEKYGTLFVVAAGNAGGDGTVGSPASADDALAVGAVTKTEELAFFSSRGPRVGDSALKPEITAPGVDIVAARGKDGQIGAPTGPDGRYMSLSGTSMATPHVAGSAAILAQQHPDWKPAQLKAALMAAAKPNPTIGVYAQGAGRVDIARAVRQAVTTSPASVSFGLQQWPHSDDKPISRTVTYHNAGASAVTLDLALNTRGPDGKPSPAGLFSVTPSTVTVPAGGDAQVTVTADTRVGDADGYAGGNLTATAGDVAAQTPLAVDKEVESYDLTVTHLDRKGQPSQQYNTLLFGLDTPMYNRVFDPSGTVKVRAPKGRYVLSTTMFGGDQQQPELIRLVQPVLNLDRAQTVAMDARLAKPVSITVPRADAKAVLASINFSITIAGGGFGSSIIGDGFNGMYSAQIGPAGKVDGFVSSVSGQWGRVEGNGPVLNSPYAYLLAWYEHGRMITGLKRTVADRDLAKVRADFAVEATGARGERLAFDRPAGNPSGGGWAAGFVYDLPNSRTEYYNVDSGIERSSVLMQQVPSTNPNLPFPSIISENDSPWTVYRNARTQHETWNQGVFGPAFPPRDFPLLWATRTGDSILVAPPMYADSAGRTGYSQTDTASTTVYRDGVKIVEEPFLGTQFTAPADPGEYRVTLEGTRGAPFSLSTRNSATWTFRSGHVDGTDPRPLPLSAIRFTPKLDLRNKAPADCAFAIPVEVQRHPDSAAGRVRSLTLEASLDDGKTWQPVHVLRHGDNGVGLLRHPKGSGFVSLRAAATDAHGNSVEQTVIRAYRY